MSFPGFASRTASEDGRAGDRAVLELDSIEARFGDVVAGAEWQAVERAAAAAETIVLLGNGGNLAVAQHGASDLAVLTDKRVLAPGDAVGVTAIANEVGFDAWLEHWLYNETRHLPADKLARSLVLGLTCAGVSPSVLGALRQAGDLGMPTALITGLAPVEKLPSTTVVLGTRYYHSTEVLATLLLYQLATAAGATARRLS